MQFSTKITALERMSRQKLYMFRSCHLVYEVITMRTSFFKKKKINLEGFFKHFESVNAE